MTSGVKKQRDLGRVLETDFLTLANGWALGLGRKGKKGRSQGCVPVCVA